jgi:flagellar biosynthetic protein FliR
MGTEAIVPAPMVLGFLLVFARVGGALVFLPIPGLRSGPSAARAAFAFFFSLAVFEAAPRPSTIADSWLLAGALLAEAAFGLAVGLLVNYTLEAVAAGMQIVSVQAGYSYASTIDPTTQAESGVLLILAQLVAGLLFFAIGMDRQVLLAFAHSLATIPAGSFVCSENALDTLNRAGGAMFANGLLVSAPVIALTLIADLALAVGGRMQQQLQMMTLAFPVKMLLALVLLCWTFTLLPTVFERWSAQLVLQMGELLR